MMSVYQSEAAIRNLTTSSLNIGTLSLPKFNSTIGFWDTLSSNVSQTTSQNFTTLRLSESSMMNLIQSGSIAFMHDGVDLTYDQALQVFSTMKSAYDRAQDMRLISTPVVQTVKLDEQRDSNGQPMLSIGPRHGTEFIIPTHNFSDKCTWFHDSIRINNQVLTPVSGTGNLRWRSPLSSSNWIDMTSGRLLNDEALAQVVDHQYAVNVTIGSSSLTPREHFMSSGGNYLVRYDEGEIEFFTPPASAPTASYSYASGSAFILQPPVGQRYVITDAEVDFSSDYTFEDEIVYETYGYAGVFAPDLVASGTLSFTDSILLKKNSYKRETQLFQESFGMMPALTINGCRPEHVSLPLYDFRRASRARRTTACIVPFKYSAASVLSSAAGMYAKMYLRHHQAFGGESVFLTFYGLVESET